MANLQLIWPRTQKTMAIVQQFMAIVHCSLASVQIFMATLQISAATIIFLLAKHTNNLGHCPKLLAKRQITEASFQTILADVSS